MTDQKNVFDKVNMLYDLAMKYEVAVIPLFEEDYLNEFFDIYEIKKRDLHLIPSEEDFDGSLRNLSGEYRWEAIAKKTKSLFGLPTQVMVFTDDDHSALMEELDDPSGLAPFFFVFDIMFCEYGEYTLCFICGSNN